MLSSALDEEINDLQSYSAFIAHWNRISDDTMEITTLESEKLVVNLSSDGWDLLTTDSQPYPTIEALLMDVSPKFNKAWNEELYRKLKMLERDE
ncbi:hypothetical protein DASB73_022830 [Starmerella bacillaris]|uniref:GSKIP domain-containing protein n=1 Tax=Starmerella bacillaris TaxID=1247836 RepID=A0AAV5RIH3_STABA|nr:hypothetical protein DASB73_022830 [Starmerella bacillaris]